MKLKELKRNDKLLQKHVYRVLEEKSEEPYYHDIISMATAHKGEGIVFGYITDGAISDELVDYEYFSEYNIIAEWGSMSEYRKTDNKTVFGQVVGIMCGVCGSAGMAYLDKTTDEFEWKNKHMQCKKCGNLICEKSFAITNVLNGLLAK